MRLDKFLYEKGYSESRNRALILIEKNRVKVNGKAEKASYDVKESDLIEVTKPIEYVSMGAYKLEKALNDFKIDVSGKICLDVGCSTGGFTQILLLGGAKKVYAVDVNTSLLDEKISSDERVETVTVNARNLNGNTFNVKPQLAVADCSFISLKHLLVPIFQSLSDDGEIVCLIKPQFECGEKALNKKGILKDKKVVYKICCELRDFCLGNSLYPTDFTFAPVRAEKNVEYFFRLSKIDFKPISYDYIKEIIDKSKLCK